MRISFVAAALATSLAAVLAAQSPSDVAQKLTGSWKLNKELSPIQSTPDPPGAPGGRRGGALLALAAPQRGGRGGGGGGGAAGGGPEPSNMMPGEIAAQAALNVLHQVPLELQIVATSTDVSFVEPRGKWDFKIDGKTVSIEVPGGAIKVKSKWDKGRLRQEFSSTERQLLKSWSVDAGGRLVMTEHVESLAFTSKESRAVYDRVK